MNEYVQLLTPRLAQYDFIGHNFVILFIPFLPQVCYFWKMCLRRYSRCLISRLESLHLEKRQLCSAATHNGKPSQPSPPPIQVALTESAGRGVFATRRIGAGDLIHTAKPIITHPTLSTLNSVCYFCLRKITSSSQHFQHHNARFCSEVCKDNAKAFYDVERRADWSVFNDYCRSQGLKYPLLVKRLACMIISGAESADCIDILQPASLSPELILAMEEGFVMLRSAFKKAGIDDEQMKFLNKQWYTNVLAQIRINAFRIELAGGLYEDLLSSAAASIESEIAVGNAIYMLPSFYNHDCGEELRICYIDASMARDARQAILTQGFGFQCNCLRCSSGD
ncbi:histone-lysine N-methyltransferase ATXR4 isoform X2 [Citrus sinensis]|uniref:histone-lysine N-methyltransferase ATXR4 isoform X2 n=1 Tax=Citrus sinensis TaxID=2711 RepID=UPI000D6266FC|nr:histone-lysine N-methyltransferase ATXR4 isoform X2 [Citrus sinensis]